MTACARRCGGLARPAIIIASLCTRRAGAASAVMHLAGACQDHIRSLPVRMSHIGGPRTGTDCRGRVGLAPNGASRLDRRVAQEGSCNGHPWAGHSRSALPGRSDPAAGLDRACGRGPGNRRSGCDPDPRRSRRGPAPAVRVLDESHDGVLVEFELPAIQVQAIRSTARPITFWRSRAAASRARSARRCCRPSRA